jgi:hypothetical protein
MSFRSFSPNCVLPANKRILAVEPRGVEHYWLASSLAYCLVSRKSVSMDQRLILPSTTLVRSAPESFVTMYSWLAAVSRHDQPHGTVLGSVDARGAHPEALSPLSEAASSGQLAHRMPLGAPEEDRPRMERTDPHQPQPRYHLGEPSGRVTGIEDDVFGTQPREPTTSP